MPTISQAAVKLYEDGSVTLECGTVEMGQGSITALARTREALHNGWDKNDPKDAQVILHMLRIGAATTHSMRNLRPSRVRSSTKS